eukprot:scaffold470_cov257-Pinguiococcus_pyrenoidosus.AAC.29
MDMHDEEENTKIRRLFSRRSRRSERRRSKLPGPFRTRSPRASQTQQKAPLEAPGSSHVPPDAPGRSGMCMWSGLACKRRQPLRGGSAVQGRRPRTSFLDSAEGQGPFIAVRRRTTQETVATISRLRERQEEFL